MGVSLSTCAASSGGNGWEIAIPKKVVIIGAPIVEGQDWADGVEQGPSALRNGGLKEVVEDLGYEVEDLGDIAPEKVPKRTWQGSDTLYAPNEVKNALSIGKFCEHIYQKAWKAAASNSFVLTLGGDHSLGAPTICGVMRARPDLCVIWVDAHGDCNTPETSPSKNYHGMPAAHTMGWFEKRLNGFEWMDDHMKHCGPLPSDRLAFIALRDVDEGEKMLLRKHNVKAFSMSHVEKYGIAKVLDKALAHINPSNSRPIHLSYDIDAIDPFVAPGTGTKARGGLSYRESLYICERLAETGRLGSVDMVEINPLIDEEELKKKGVHHTKAPLSPVMSEGSPLTSPLVSPIFDDEAMHGDNPKIKGPPTVRLGIELIERALGKQDL